MGTHCLSNKLQVTVSVVDAVNNTEIWSEHFNRSLDDLFWVQEEITRIIVMVVDSSIEKAEIERAFRTPPLKTSMLGSFITKAPGIWNRRSLKVQRERKIYFKKQ